jgi:hypothetical protein
MKIVGKSSSSQGKLQFHIISPRPECGKPHSVKEADNHDRRNIGSPEMVGSWTPSPNNPAATVHKFKNRDSDNTNRANDTRTESSTPRCGMNRPTDFMYPLPEEGEYYHLGEES